MGQIILGSLLVEIVAASINLDPLHEYTHLTPARVCDISFNSNFQGSQNPHGSYNSARIETTVLRVRVTLFNSRPASANVTTGKSFDFFAL